MESKIVKISDTELNAWNALLKAVQAIIQDIIYTGVSYANNDFLKKIDAIFSQTSKMNQSRLAISLRYIRIELNRSINDIKLFSIDRLIFFTTQAWMFVSKTQSLLEQKAYSELLEFVQLNNELKKITQLSARLIGVQSFHLKGSVMGYTFYFFSLNPFVLPGIFSCDILRSYQATENLSTFLSSTWNTPFFPNQLFFNDITFSKIEFNPTTRKIDLSGDSNFIINLTQEIIIGSTQAKYIGNLKNTIEKHPDPDALKEEIKVLEQYSFQPLNLLSHIDDLEKYCTYSMQQLHRDISEYHITPIDTPKSFHCFMILKNVEVQEIEENEKDLQKKKKEKLTLTNWKYTLHSSNFQNPIIISIDSKPANKPFKTYFDTLSSSPQKIEQLFCLAYLSGDVVEVYPLMIYDKKEEIFPAIDKYINFQIKKDLKRFLKKVPYQKKEDEL